MPKPGYGTPKEQPQKAVTGPSRTPEERADDLARMALWLRKGWTAVDIREALGNKVTLAQVRYDINVIKQQAKAEMYADARAELSMKIRELGLVKKEAWEQYELSKSRTKRVKVGDEYEEVAIGADPAWLNTVYDVVVKECELQGLKIPSTKELGDESVGDAPMIELILPIIKEGLRQLAANGQASPKGTESVAEQLRRQAALNDSKPSTIVLPPDAGAEPDFNVEDFLGGKKDG